MKTSNINPFLPIFPFFFWVFSLSAQTTYYTNLLQELDTQYGLTGGELTIGGNENLLQQAAYTNVTPQFNTISGQAFEQSVQLAVSGFGPDPWSQRADYLTATDINAGDILLLVAWVRNNNPNGEDDMGFSFQELASPWGNSHYTIQDIPANGIWQRIFLPMDANMSHPTNQTILQLHLGLDNINFEIGGLAVINFGQQYQLSDLPQQEVRNYYVDLMDEMSNDFGLTGGEYVIGGNENLLQEATHVNITPQFHQINDQAFQLSAQMLITSAGPNPWTQAVNYLTIADVDPNDILLLTCYVRAYGDGTASEMAFSFQEANEPWSNSEYEIIDVPSTGQWFRIMHPLDANHLHPSGQTILQLHLGIENIDFEIGGLALINFNQNYELNDLPEQQIIYYDGIEPDAAWRAAAASRIEQHRKADLNIMVVDANNNPVEGANVQIEMQNPEFRYGSFEAVVLLETDPVWDFYKSEFYRLFNYGTTGIYWSSHEPDNYNQALAVTNNLLQNGLDVRLHPILWGTIGPNWSSLPDDVLNALNQNNTAYVRQRIDQRIPDITDRFKTLVTDYDVLNEPSHVTSLQDLLGANEDVTWFQKVRQEDPNNKLFINDFQILSLGAEVAPRNAYKDVIENLLIQNAPLDGVGFQGHMFSTPTPPERVYNVIEEFYQLGLDYGQDFDFKITEYDTQGMNDELAGLYMNDFLTAIFSHPKVTSFTMWGFWDGLHWLDDGPFYYQDWTPKPALAAYENLLFNEWWTDENRVSDGNGNAFVRGFKGDYLVMVTYEENTVQQWVSLTEDRTIKIQFDQILSVEGLDFSVSKWNKNTALLEWVSFGNGNTDYFEIQRAKRENEVFKTLKILPLTSSLANLGKLEYIDAVPLPHINYYRIKEVAKDGNVFYSEIKALDFNNLKEPSVQLFPTIAKSGEKILVENLNHSTDIYLEVINAIGERVFQQNEWRGNFYLDTTDWQAGVYFVSVSSRNQKEIIRILIL